MNKAKFFEEVKKTLFNGKLTKAQVDGLETILDEWFAHGGGQRQQLAYVLATPYHEVGPSYKPIRENLNYTSVASLRRVWPSRFKTDESAKRFVKNAKGLAIEVYGGRLGNKPAPSEDGWFFRGGGYEQRTGRDNYARIGIAGDPDKILEPEFAAKSIVSGMRSGEYTGKKLSDYINGDKVDYINARRIINGDVGLNGAKIAGYAQKFDDALARADYSTTGTPDVGETKKPATKTTGIAAVIVGAIIAVGVWLKSIGIIP